MNSHTLHQPTLARRGLLRAGMLLLAIALSHSAVAQQTATVEYWVDSDPGMGKAHRTETTVAADGSIDFGALANGLTPGSHLIGIRAFTVDDSGVPHYGPTLTQNFIVPQSAENVTSVRAEYFFDDEPGFGLGTPFEAVETTSETTQGQSATNVSIDVDLSVVGLSSGLHRLGYRLQSGDKWSPTMWSEFIVQANEKIVEAEYFFDNDPGFGHANTIAIAEGKQVSISDLGLSTEGLAPGAHQFFIRYRGTGGWSPTFCAEFFNIKEDMAVIEAEYFWNEDPGFGKGTPVPTEALGGTTADVLAAIPTSDIHGDATFCIRYRGPLGWSPTLTQLVMVDAEGHYTLNAQAETSVEQRNYQTMGDAIGDFADRGVGNDITLQLPTTGLTYTLDATAEGLLAEVQQVAQRLDAISTERVAKTITLQAAAGSGNTVSIEADALVDVMPLLAHVRTENVTLLVNGTAYDFTPLAQRSQTICTGTATTAVDLSTLGPDVSATFVAQPHEATVLSGFAAEATVTLPAMTLTNVGTRTDSLAYAVMLSDADGEELYAYTYYIYARASLTAQHFSNLQPAAGASLNPGTTTLSWAPLQEVEGYRLSISDVSTEPATSIVSGLELEPTTTRYDLTLESGHRYEWQVVAVGACDELASPLMNVEGRLLPDLVVESFSMPEAAQAGNQLNITVSITNQGEGATTEGTWTDRLYYTINSTDFGQATQIAQQQHTGNVAAGEGYEATFSIRVPAVEDGQLRLFVVTDAAAQVLETNDDNNRTLSQTAATLAPFYMNSTDLAALRQLYADLGGSSWTGAQWNVASELISDQNWSGVSFDTEGRVTAINLQGRGLSGTLTVAVPYVATMSQLQSLNLSRNTLTGDASAFLAGAGETLTSVDLSYNQLHELSAPLPATIATLSLANQHRRYGANATYPGLDDLSSQALGVGSSMQVELSPMVAYDHQAQAFTQHPQLNVWNTAMQTRYGQLSWSATNECYVYAAYTWQQHMAQDEAVMLVSTASASNGTVMPATLHLTTGDANLSGYVDVNDVQRTLNYVIDLNNSTTFSYWAANTYSENEPADLINIQDIVSTVNIVLADQNFQAASARAASMARMAASVSGDSVAGYSTPAARFYAAGRYITLDALEEVAAFSLELRGATADQVRLLLNRNDWQMQTRNTDTGVRLLVFSPTGQTLPTGTTQLLRLSADGQPVAVQATNAQALPVEAAIGSTTTGIAAAEGTTDAAPVYDLQGRRVATGQQQVRHLRKGIYIMNGKKMKR